MNRCRNSRHGNCTNRHCTFAHDERPFGDGFAQWNPFYIRPCITGLYTHNIPFKTSRLQAHRPHLYPQGASGHRGLLQNEVVQICRQWPLQVTWWNGWQKQQKVDVGFQWPRQMRQEKKVCTDREKGGFFDLLSGFLRISFCYLLLLGFGMFWAHVDFLQHTFLLWQSLVQKCAGHWEMLYLSTHRLW